MTRNEYVHRVLHQYRRLPGASGRILRADRRLALALHERRIPIAVVNDAFVLAVVRRHFRSDATPLEPIRSLHYLKPVIQELLDTPPDPGYLDYLNYKLSKVGIQINT
jgi:hypothetical protein